MTKVNFRLYFITDRHQCTDKPLLDIISEASQAGVKAVQLREKDLSPIELYNLASETIIVCRKTQTKLFINDRADIAEAVEADGVQLTSKSLPVKAVRKCLKSERLIGVSTHSFEEARKAEDSGCDFILFGPIFQTPSKIAYGKPLGLKSLFDLRKMVNVPIFAVGGINPDRAKKCLENGAFGVAVISSIVRATDINKVISDFKNYLGDV